MVQPAPLDGGPVALYSEPTASKRFTTMALGVIGLAVAIVFAVGIGLLVGDSNAAAGAVVGLLIAVALVGGCGYQVLRTLRYNAILHGSVLTIRGAFSERSVDLSTAAEVAVDRGSENAKGVGPFGLAGAATTPHRGRIPRIGARESADTPWVSVMLVDPRSRRRMSTPGLRALATAIEGGHRSAEQAARAHAIADALRKLP